MFPILENKIEKMKNVFGKCESKVSFVDLGPKIRILSTKCINLRKWVPAPKIDLCLGNGIFCGLFLVTEWGLSKVLLSPQFWPLI